MLLQVFVYAKLCEQGKGHPDGANERRAQSSVRESREGNAVHTQRGVKEHFSQIPVTGILKERKTHRWSHAWAVHKDLLTQYHLLCAEELRLVLNFKEVPRKLPPVRTATREGAFTRTGYKPLTHVQPVLSLHSLKATFGNL